MKTRVVATICLTTLLGACLVELPDPINIRDMLVSSAFDGKIMATVEKGSTYNSLNSVVNTVSAVVYYGSEEGVSEEFASGTYANGGFVLTLPQQPASKYFQTLEGFPVHVSD